MRRNNSCRNIERLIGRYVNASRRKRRLGMLRGERGLTCLSRSHSRRMAKRGRIWHGSNVHRAGQHVKKDFFDMLFRGSMASGENVAMMSKGRVRGIRGRISSDKDIALAFHKTWMKSVGHKMNILNSSFSKSGIGVTRKGNRFYATQLFYG